MTPLWFNSRSMSGFGVIVPGLLDTRMAVRDQPLLAGNEGFRDVRAEPLLVDDWFRLGDNSLVEPGRGLGGCEPLDRPIGHDLDPGVAHLGLPATARQRDHHPRLGDVVARELARLGIVDAPIDPVDDEILAVGHLVGDPDLDDAADDRLGFPCATEDGEVASRAVDAVRAHDLVHGDHDVAALAQAAQLGFELGIDGPDAGLLLLRQAHLLQSPQPANPHAELRAFGTTLGPAARTVAHGRHDEHVLLGVLQDAAIERCEPLRLHLVGELNDALELLLGPQLQGDEVLRAMADAVADVMARHHESPGRGRRARR